LADKTTTKQDGDPAPKAYSATTTTTATTDGASAGVGLYAIILLGGLLAYLAYTFMQKK
jgi:hypothetical protein